MFNCIRKINSKLKSIRLRLEDRNFLTLLKLMEIKFLKSNASTYCYNFPSHVLIELTARCNLRCLWCQQSEATFRDVNKEDMSLENALSIIQQLKGCNVLLLYNIGEPLLYPHLFEVIKEARKYIPNVRITTNGTLLTKEVSLKLRDAGLTQLNISIDSPDAEMFYKIRKVKLEKIVSNVEQFCDITGIPLQIWSVISENNMESLQKIPELVRRFSTCRQLYFQLVDGFDLTDKVNINMVFSQEKFELFRRLIVDKCDSMNLRTNLEFLPYYPDGYSSKKVIGICSALMTTLISINNKGFINPCCSYRNKNLDSVLELGFKKAWNGPKVREWRKKMLYQKYDSFCNNWCGYRKM